MKNDRRVMSHCGRVIWVNPYGYLVAKGDGTDEYFENIQQAMKYCEENPKTKRKLKGASA